MEKIKTNKWNIVYLLCILIISIGMSLLIEFFGFNHYYFSLPKNERGNEILLEKNDFILNDLEIDGEGYFTITGENPSFRIRPDTGIYYLIVQPEIVGEEDLIKPYQIKCVENGNNNVLETYRVNESYETVSYLRINEDSSKVSFELQFLNEENIENIGSRINLGNVMIDNQFIINWYRLFAVFSLVCLLLILTFFRKTIFRKLEIVFLLIIVLLGTNIAILKPNFVCFDEQAHFIKSYRLASGDLGILNDAEIMYPESFDSFYNHVATFDSLKERKSYESSYNVNDYTVKDHYSSTADTYLPFAYIAPALGIFIGKITKMPFFAVFYLGRIFSIAAYAAMIFWTLKRAKYAKRLIFILSLLPGMVYLATSYSVDGILYASALMMVSTYLNIMTDKKESRLSSWLVLLISYLLMISCKPTYLFLGIFVFTIPLDRFNSKKEAKIIKISTILMGILMALFAVIYMNVIVQPPSDMKGITWSVGPEVNGKEQLIFIITNLLAFLKICYHFVVNSFFNCFTHPIGQYGYVENMPMLYIIMAFVAIIIITIVDDENDLLKISMKNKMVYALSIFLSWGAVVGTLYLTFNPVGSTIIDGVQGRYFAPLLLPFLLLFKCTKIENKYNKENLNKVVTVFSIILLLTIFWTLLTKYNM